MTVQIDITHHSGDWPPVESLVKTAVETTMEHISFSSPKSPAPTPGTGETEISVVLAGDSFVHDLNKTYRSKDTPTNVLSFPQDEPGLMGDVILACETLAREAREQNKSFEDHMTHLCVHGVLHLLGYDHESPEEAEEMEALEVEILKRLDVKNPYETL